MLVWKLTLVPTLIALVSIVGQRYGPAMAGLLAGLPVVAGPIFLFMTAENGTAFGVQVAVNTLVGLLPFAAFTVGYGWLCRTFPWPICLGVSWILFLGIALLLSQASFSLLAAATMATAIPFIVPRLYPRLPPTPAKRALPRYEIPVRMLAAGMLVVTITEAAKSTGPQLAGLLTPFPILASVLTAFSHRLHGPATTIAVLRGLIVGLFGFVAFFVIEASSLQPLGVVPATLAAAAGAIGTQGVVYWLIRRRHSASRNLAS